MTATGEPESWAKSLTEAIRSEPIECVNRVIALAETGSTQDSARELAAGRPGLMVLADRQTAGRGRLGRAWTQGGSSGLAVTFVLSTARVPPERLALAAGIGAAVAIEAALHRAGVDGLVGLRWPNDVVEGPGKAGNAIRMKLAGVLIEAADGLAYVGIGINVNQTAEDFPQHLRERAISIRQIAAARGDWRAAGPVDRLEVATDLLRSLGRVIRPGFDVMTEWSRRDVLRGRMQSFRYDGRTFAGRVVSMDPLGLILIKTNDGEIVQLPALSTSLVHDA